MEILENNSFWFSFEHGNTGTQAILIQFWSKTDGRTGGRAGGRAGRVTEKHNLFWEYVSWKTLTLYISLNIDFLIFFQKRRAPKFHEIWCDFRGEISHMRPIQARKLKLIKVLISYYFHIIFMFWGIWHFVYVQYRMDIPSVCMSDACHWFRAL